MTAISELFKNVFVKKNKNIEIHDENAFKNYNEEIIIVVAGVLLFVFLYLFFNYACQLLSILIPLVFPFYQSIISLNNGNENDKTKWVKYWIVYALFSFLEPVLIIILGNSSIYWNSKTILFGWLIMYNGTDYMYNLIALPFYQEVTQIMVKYKMNNEVTY